jgi:hypothetical protein
MDKLYLTRAPIFVGRTSEPATLALVDDSSAQAP